MNKSEQKIKNILGTDITYEEDEEPICNLCLNDGNHVEINYLAEATAKYFLTENKGHDKLFKEALKNKMDFIEFIEQFVSKELAKELIENNIEIYDRKFITNSFTEIESDIIYKVKNKALYIIIENQSTIDKNMSYRMLEYTSEIIKEYMQITKKESEKYPKIIPIVISTSNRKWNAKLKYSEKEEKIKGLNKSYIDLEYILVDINQYTKEELYEKNTMLSYLMLLEKAETKEEYEETIEKMINNLREENISKMARFVKCILGQLLEEEKVEQIIEELSKKGGKKVMPSALERFMLKERKEGREEGRREGREAGRREGRQEGRKEARDKLYKAAGKLLKHGVKINIVKEATGLTEKELQELQANK